MNAQNIPLNVNSSQLSGQSINETVRERNNVMSACNIKRRYIFDNSGSLRQQKNSSMLLEQKPRIPNNNQSGVNPQNFEDFDDSQALFSSTVRRGPQNLTNLSKVGSAESNGLLSVSKNRFTLKDSRFQQLQEANKFRSVLKREVVSLTRELEEVDEFKFVLAQKPENSNFHEKRIDLLKAQIKIQQKYIQRITGLLKQTKKQNQELMDILDFLKRQFLATHPLPGRTESQIPEGPETQKAFFENLDRKASLEKLETQLKRQEAREEFFVEFNLAFAKLKKISEVHLNAEQLSESKEKGGELSLRLRDPVRDFLEKYRSYFDFRSIFERFPTKERDTFNNWVTVLQAQVRESALFYKKVRAFRVFQSNKFYFRETLDDLRYLNLPVALSESKTEDRLANAHKYQSFTLDYQQIVDAEQKLGTLFEKILDYTQRFAPGTQGYLNLESNEVLTSLRESMECLLQLGIMINENEQDPSQYLITFVTQLDRLQQSSSENPHLSRSQTQVQPP